MSLFDYYIDSKLCFKALNETHDASRNVMDSFRELGVFNIAFFEAAETLMDRLKVWIKSASLYSCIHLIYNWPPQSIARKLEVEYCISSKQINYGPLPTKINLELM